MSEVDIANNFTAIDVETANADMASICQIGVAKYVDGELTEEWSTLVDPEDYFDYVNNNVFHFLLLFYDHIVILFCLCSLSLDRLHILLILLLFFY